MIFSVEMIYRLMGIIVLGCSFYIFADQTNNRRLTSGCFYLIYAITLMFGRVLPPFYIGLLVIFMVLIIAGGGLKKSVHIEESVAMKEERRKKFGGRLFIPAILIPVLTLVGSKGLDTVKFQGKPLLDPSNVTMVALGLSCIIAILSAMWMTRGTPKTTIKESRRLLESVGWAVLLPQLLATLGTVYTNAGVGTVVSNVVTSFIPKGSLFWVVVIFCLGMALFTMVMGNAFAAFPVLAAGIAIPLLIKQFDANPNHIAAISMFAGYCGTLMTPMAANFNIVPAALLDLKDKNHVIKVQVPTALIVLFFNIILMYCLVSLHI
ncbi:DUF979 domain-containing protein [Fictibacillus sp. WQ 8-8]|uniref:DUF979 domain-containing protein n=1 Tax=Fictibacillus sp. WQ 8-8 TaxID=2938788 RepID=UPI00210E0F8F|nr:DUF979 domain-containing protein [Fictibacillus sp. WQ 8-8]MCQ6267843.1 DUF979 domain-containing protein [Fictibacillus sp. WQ 8-8]